VYRGFDLLTKKQTEILYGVPSGGGYGQNAEIIKRQSLEDYMRSFPGHPDGLFGIAESLSKSIGKKIHSRKINKCISGILWKEKQT